MPRVCRRVRAHIDQRARCYLLANSFSVHIQNYKAPIDMVNLYFNPKHHSGRKTPLFHPFIGGSHSKNRDKQKIRLPNRNSMPERGERREPLLHTDHDDDQVTSLYLIRCLSIELGQTSPVKCRLARNRCRILPIRLPSSSSSSQHNQAQEPVAPELPLPPPPAPVGLRALPVLQLGVGQRRGRR